MQSKWDSKSSVLLRQQIKTAIDPLIARHKYYILAKANMLKNVADYFFTESNEDCFLDVTRWVAGQLDVAPVDKQLLEHQFEGWEDFTETILASGLGLVQEDDFFAFHSLEGIKPDTIELMNKLALALSACRICIGIEQIYRAVLDHQHIQTQEFEQCLVQVKELANDYNAGAGSTEEYAFYLRTYYCRALTLQKALKEQYIKVNAHKEDFAELMQKALVTVCELIKHTGVKLIAEATKFPNKTWRGDAWNAFLVRLLSELVARYYHYTFIVSGSLSLNLEYLALLSTEQATFSLTMQDHMPYLKLAFLNEAEIELGALMRTMQNEAALSSIILVEERPKAYSSGILDLLFSPKDDPWGGTEDYGPQYTSRSYEFK
ncbi:hypothetical protein [uncultured Legionella sp.]|uniref:hypothetical protein n=1 Tax=uncultured Legionella sp. TaxID=210934 RepID=UPI00261EAC6F|nr:hypothetical protein [uncultured Legionella sp.]